MYIVELAVAGLVAGAAYALSSLGLVVIYKGSGVLNFAQGAVGMVGTFVYANAINAGKPLGLAIFLGLGSSAIVGLAIYLAVMRPLRRSAPAVRMVATFAVLLLLQGAAQLRWGTSTTSVRPIIPQHELRANGVTIGTADLLTIGVAIAIAVGLGIAFARLTVGKATEAAAVGEEAAMRLGYRVNLLAAGTWVLGSVLAGLAGILIAPNIGINVTVLTLIMINALAAALVGRFKSLGITVLAAFVIGAAESVLTTQFSQQPGWSNAVPFFVIVAMLATAGRAVPSRAEASEQRLPLAAYPKLSLPPIIASGALFVALPLILDQYWQLQAVLGIGVALVVLSVVLLTGYLGQVSLMQWGVAGVGAFVSGTLALSDHLPMLVAIAIAGILAFVLCAAISLPILRIRGLDVAIVTLGAGIALQSLLLGQFWGTTGLVLPAADLFDLRLTQREFLYLAEGILIIVVLTMWSIRRGRTGQRMLAIRGSERAAAGAGLSSSRVKALTFGFAGAIAAIGGSLWAFGTASLTTSAFSPLMSIQILAFAFINGVGSISGAVVAGIAIAAAPPFLQNILHVQGTDWFSIIGGLGVIITLIQHPDGAFVRVRRPAGQGSRGAPLGVPEGMNAPGADIPQPRAVRVD